MSLLPGLAGTRTGLLLLCVSLIIVAELIRRVNNVFRGPLSKFPGPKLRAFTSIPKVITLCRGREHSDLVDLHNRYGSIVRVAPRELSFAGGADAWKDIMGFKKEGQPVFSKNNRFYAGEGRMFTRENVLLANADDAQHSKLRRVISHAFADKSIRDIEPMLLHWAGKFNDKLHEFAREGSMVDMVKTYNCTTFDIMGDLAFNQNLGMLDQGDENEWVKSVFQGIKASTFLRALRNCGDFGWWFVDNVLMALPAASQGMRRTIGFSSERVKQRLASSPTRPDLWTQILARGVGDQFLDQQEHEGLAFFFMVAGSETTASALSGILYFLLENPACMANLKAEVRSAFSSYDDVTLEKVARLRYTSAIIQEGLRMYPPVPISLPRHSPPGGGMALGQYIPGDVVCGVHHMSTYRSPKFFKNPNNFHPERWLNHPAYKDDQLNAVEPFQVGPRNCVGKNLAWHELRLLLVASVLSYDLKAGKESADWLDRGRVYTIWEKPPLMCTVELTAKKP